MIILTILAGMVFLMVLAGVICYRTLAVPAMKQLGENDRKICSEIAARGKGYPFICRRAVKTGKCGCLPCKKLEQAKMNTPGHP